MKTKLLTDDRQAKDNATAVSDPQIRSMCWFIAPSLMNERHRQEWEHSMKTGIERFSARFNRLPVRVILRTVPLPEGWDASFPGIVFQHTKSILPGHFVLCNDAGEFFGTRKARNLDAG